MSAEQRLELRALGEAEQAHQHDADPQPDERRPGEQEHDEPERAAEVDADDQRLAPDPVRQPAGDQRHRHREDDERAVHQAGRRLVEPDDPGQVDQREQVDDAEPATAAAERPRSGTASAGRGRAGSARTRTGRCRSATAAARSVPRSRTSSRIAIAMAMAGSPNTTDAPRQPTAAMSGTPMSATMTVPTLPPAMWALIANPRRSGGNCSASRPLPTGCWGEPPIRESDVRDREGQEARREAPGARSRRRTGSRRRRAAAAARRPGSAPRS